MNASIKFAAVWTVLSLITAGVCGQVMPVQDGRALDSNYRLGSGPINSVVSNQPQLTSQMYITGQVTGLGAFKGHVGYQAGDQLRMTVPSAALSDFNRRSVGVSDVLRGGTWRAGIYQDRATTALTAGGIAAGLAAPGTNVPRASYVRDLVPQKVMDNALSDFRPLMGKRLGRAISSDLRPVRPLGGTQSHRSPGSRTTAAYPAGAPAFGAAGLALFTVSRPARRGEVDRELLEFEYGLQDDPTRLDTRADRPAVTVKTGDPGKVSGLGSTRRTAPSSDAFLALVYVLQQQYLTASGADVRKPADGGQGMTLKPLGARPDSVEFVEQGKRGELIFKTLAGKGKDGYNAALRKAEALLKGGRFYDAANQYRLAVEIAPDNPMARLGLSVALFGAGEPLSSALQLRRAMEIFPPVMVTTLKVVRQISQETLGMRLERIYKRIEGRTGANVNAQLAMLAAYMHLGAGERYRAEVCAKKLKTAGGADDLHRAFAAYVLTGKRPAAKGPTTRPAGGKQGG